MFFLAHELTVIFRLEWWFSWEVQDFIQLVLHTGLHIEHRWNEQATQAMISHLFLSENRLHLVKEFIIHHGREKHEFDCDPCGVGWES